GQGTYILDLQSLGKESLSASQYIFMADIWNPEHLSQSLHIWLPIQFTADGTPRIEWRETIGKK
ncbi:MAG: hypothetical protein IJR86_04575, partial [Bacteroidaceae bacterium]|nr:hypothetical protein [Bacteroidaceae bacterium]